jgi:preprotein translocase subunit SecE
MADKIKFALALLLMVAGVSAYYLIPGEVLALWRALVVAASLGVAFLVFLKTEQGARFITLCRESRDETRKVVWPGRKETMQMTGIVFAFVVVMAIFLFFSDKTLEWVMYDLILGWNRS